MEVMGLGAYKIGAGKIAGWNTRRLMRNPG